ncbi:MAG: YrhK family protein [Desulfarculaceae bacterium]|nr:YrhK family protein [Desulfarculaceae bacterium]
MPHMIVNRPRLYDFAKNRTDLRAQFRWETINAILYKLGGMVFIVGSILFFPVFTRYSDIGAWVFFGGSLVYLVVTVHDLAEVRRFWRSNHHHKMGQLLEYIAASAYVSGTVLFTVGSTFFLTEVGMFQAGAWCFVMGSLLFVLAACINVLQILKSSSIITLQLMNLTAVSFVVGSVLFTVASVPYLWKIHSAIDQTILYRFLAFQYLIGSVLFFVGGVFNYWRAYIIMRQEIVRLGNAGP